MSNLSRALQWKYPDLQMGATCAEGDYVLLDGHIFQWCASEYPQPDEASLIAEYEEDRTGLARDRRLLFEKEIEAQRISQDIRPIDLAADPGLQGILDETNEAALAKLNELYALPDDQLASFNPVLEPSAVGAIASAESLYNQEKRLLDDPKTTLNQTTELQVAMDAHKAVILGNDNAAVVPPVPDSMRRMIGVPLEGFGILKTIRFESEGWWFPQFSLSVERAIDTDNYWIAIYNETDTYMSTSQLEEVIPGLAYEAKPNLGRAKDFVFKYTLCYRHISASQFEKITLPANMVYQTNRVRWSGITDESLPRAISKKNKPPRRK